MAAVLTLCETYKYKRMRQVFETNVKWRHWHGKSKKNQWHRGWLDVKSKNQTQRMA